MRGWTPLSVEFKDYRFFCLCGQKMRIIPDMLGKPGKCVSCRRKFWIPLPDEAVAIGRDIRLVDHPELMREPGQRVRGQERAGSSPPEPVSKRQDTPVVAPSGLRPADTDSKPKRDSGFNPEKLEQPATPAPRQKPLPPNPALLREDSDPGLPAEPVKKEASATETPPPVEKPPHEEAVTALDPLEPLQILLSLEARLLPEGENGGGEQASPEGMDTETANAYTRIVRRARRRLDRRLKDLLFEADERLVAVMEDIAKVMLSFRVGELGPELYFARVGALRARRENLERQRVNLKGWLCAANAHEAGGRLDTGLDAVNLETIGGDIPPVSEDPRPPLQRHTDELRLAFEARSLAERRHAEWRRLAQEENLPAAAALDGRMQAESERRRARARVAFCQARLKQVVKDFESDMGAVEAYQRLLAQNTLPAARGGLNEQQAAEERELLERALADLRNLRQWARGALGANSPGDLPNEQPTLFRRLNAPGEISHLAREAAPAYGAALAFLVAAVFFPVNSVRFFLIMGALLACLVTVLQGASRRGLAFSGLWIVMTFVLGLGLGLGRALGSAAGGWEIWAGVAVGILGWGGMAAATHMAMRGEKSFWWIAPASGFMGVVLFAVAVMVAPLTAGKMAVPTPGRPAVVKPPSAALPPLSPASQPETAAEPAPTPLAVSPPTPPAPPVSSPSKASETALPKPPAIPPVAVAAPPTPADSTQLPQVVPGQDGQDLPQNGQQQPESVETMPENVDPATYGSTVEMRGVFHKEGMPPRFRLVVNHRDGRTTPVDVNLGDTIVGNWRANEYSSSTKKLTISNGQKMLILDAGSQVPLE